MAIDLNLVSTENQHSLVVGESFRLICFLNTELWSSEFIELDVCGRPLFANPVTFTVYGDRQMLV